MLDWYKSTDFTGTKEKLLFVSNQYPTREPTVTDFHFGELGEIVVLNLLASLAQMDKYGWVC